MKVSIDFDGTLWQHMDFFRNLMKALQAAGHQVGILTGHSNDPDHIKKDIDLMVARGFPKPDFFFGRTPEYMPFNGSKLKADRIISEGISMHFDDMDFGNPESERIFHEKGVTDRVCRVYHREPRNVHYE